MPPDRIAQLTLVAYGLLFAALPVWRAWRDPLGWQVWLLYRIGTLYGRFCFRWRANRPCPFEHVSPAIIIANHRSPLDPLLIWIGVLSGRPLGFLTAREYCEQPGLRFINKHMESIPVARDGKDMGAMRAALRRLQSGNVLGIFPEGRINKGNGLLPADPGVAWIVLRSRAPVYPVFIHNAPGGPSMVAPFFNFRPVRVTYGDPIDLSDLYERGVSSDVLREATDRIMSGLAALEDNPDTRDCGLRIAPADDVSPNILARA